VRARTASFRCYKQFVQIFQTGFHIQKILIKKEQHVKLRCVSFWLGSR